MSDHAHGSEGSASALPLLPPVADPPEDLGLGRAKGPGAPPGAFRTSGLSRADSLGFSLPSAVSPGDMIGAMAGSVLVVDDDPAFRGLARRVLTAAGLSVVGEAESVQSAREAATALRPDGVLVDVMLPDGDGVTLARELAALPWSPRVVLTSSYADAASEDEVRRCGAVAFVPKQELPTAPLGRFLGDA